MSVRITFLEPLEPTPGRARGARPRAARSRRGEQPFAWVVAGERVRRTPLTLGRDFGDRVQVTRRPSRGRRRRSSSASARRSTTVSRAW